MALISASGSKKLVAHSLAKTSELKSIQIGPVSVGQQKAQKLSFYNIYNKKYTKKIIKVQRKLNRVHFSFFTLKRMLRKF